MQTVDYVNVLKGCADLCGLDPEAISTQDNVTLRNAISRRLRTAWIRQRWPDLLALEKRYFRPVFSLTASYGAGTEIYFPQTMAYYACVNNGTTGIAPADVNGNTTNPSWMLIATSYSAPNYSAAQAVTAGTLVYDPTTDLFYWATNASTGQSLYNNLAFWSVINPFKRYVSKTQTGFTAIGTVFCVTDKDPRADLRAAELIWGLTENGVQVYSDVALVWIEFRLPAPRLTGANYSATTAYAAGAQFYYSSATTNGNFYNVATATTAGQNPDNTPASFSQVQIPHAFESYLEPGASADFLLTDGKEDEAAVLSAMAESNLADTEQVLRGQEGQSFNRTEVCTR